MILFALLIGLAVGWFAARAVFYRPISDYDEGFYCATTSITAGTTSPCFTTYTAGTEVSE